MFITPVRFKISLKAYLIIDIKWNNFAKDFNFEEAINKISILIINVIKDIINLNDKNNWNFNNKKE